MRLKVEQERQLQLNLERQREAELRALRKVQSAEQKAARASRIAAARSRLARCAQPNGPSTTHCTNAAARPSLALLALTRALPRPGVLHAPAIVSTYACTTMLVSRRRTRTWPPTFAKRPWRH